MLGSPSWPKATDTPLTSDYRVNRIEYLFKDECQDQHHLWPMSHKPLLPRRGDRELFRHSFCLCKQTRVLQQRVLAQAPPRSGRNHGRDGRRICVATPRCRGCSQAATKEHAEEALQSANEPGWASDFGQAEKVLGYLLWPPAALRQPTASHIRQPPVVRGSSRSNPSATGRIHCRIPPIASMANPRSRKIDIHSRPQGKNSPNAAQALSIY